MSRRQELSEAISAQIRRQQVRTDAFDDTVATALGVNRTDFRCLDVLDQEGALSAGELAKAVGLSTAAITTVLDRLEARGFAVRRPDPKDRRRVLVELTPKMGEFAGRFYAPLAATAEQLYAQFSEDELELLLRFLETANGLFAGMLDDLKASLKA
jgi:DNA-binding MarR family transcriptional regulator